MKKRTLGSYLAECEDFVKDLATNKKLCVTDDTISNMIKQNHWLWELTPNNIVDVYYDVIPKQDGDYDTPSYFIKQITSLPSNVVGFSKY